MKSAKYALNELQQYKKKIASLIMLGFSGRGKNSKKIISAYKNKYKGNRCFILGNGPSLCAKDLEKLKNEITFASNRIYPIFEKTSWRPTFWSCFDESILESDSVVDNINQLDVEMKFVRKEGYCYNRRLTGELCYVHTWTGRKYLDHPAFSLDLARGAYTIATVTYFQIQLARYMGFEEIYLLGVDHKYQNTVMRDGTVVRDSSVSSYFGNSEKLDKTIKAATWEMDIAYEYARKFADTNSFKIYNATRGGFLEAFERVDFDTLF